MRLLILTGMLGLSQMLLAADAGAPPDLPPPPFIPAASSSDYQKVREIQQKVGAPEALPQAGAAQQDMLLGLADSGARAGQESNIGNLKSEDYDALYALLQKYRDELRTLGLKDKSLEDMLVELRRREDDSERRIKNLSKFNFDGLKILGHISMTYDDVDFFGPGSPVIAQSPTFPIGTTGPPGPGIPAKSLGIPLRYRTTKEMLDLEFIGSKGPLSMKTVLDNAVYSGWVQAGSIFDGFTRLELEARLPIVVQVAQFDAHMSPLTLWRNEDTWRDEPEPFASRRQTHRDDLFLHDNDLSLRGVRLATDLVVAENQVIHMQAMLHGVGLGRNALYYLGGYPAPNTTTTTTNQPNTVTDGPYDTFMGAWQAQSTLWEHLDLGYAGTEMGDAIDSAAGDTYGNFGTTTGANNGYAPIKALNNQTVKGFNSQVHSGQAGLQFLDGKLRLEGEYAESLYSNPNREDFYANTVTAQGIGYKVGHATLATASYDNDWISVSGQYRNVERSFISTPAQGRTQDTNYSFYGPFMHENVFFNSVTADYSTYYLAPAFPQPFGLENFNGAILPPEMLGAPASPDSGGFFFNYLLPYDAAINPGSPYGAATPNRDGFSLNASLKLMNGILKPWADMDQLAEISGVSKSPFIPVAISRAAETYGSYDLGTELDLQPAIGLPLQFTVTYGQRQVKSPDWVSFSSELYTAGAQYHINEKTVVYLGIEHNNCSGTLAYPLYGAYGDPLNGTLMSYQFQVYPAKAYKYQEAYDDWAIGLGYDLNEHCHLSVDYGAQNFSDALALASGIRNGYEMDQGDIRVDLKF